ncbi:hypothetical protein SDC9_193177 [bioreactor metagenome]|uniref:Uncharacterized protein n=1 Tax=bioreactor metagenome TaxID=1076179 RepID=A0A645I3A6_9ZZZZ
MLEAEVDRRQRAQAIGREVTHQVRDAQFFKRVLGVDQDETLLLQAGEHIDLTKQGRILDDQGIRHHDRLTQADLAISDTAESHHWRSCPLRTKTREGLCMTPFLECGDRQHFRRRHHPLASAAVNTHFEHTLSDPLIIEATPPTTHRLDELMELNDDG